MIEARLRYEGNGRFSPGSHDDFVLVCSQFKQGEIVVARFVRERSSRENRLFHGAIKSAYDNQRGGPLFSEEEGGWLKLRAWLLCEAGHCDLHQFEPGAVTEPVIKVLKELHPTAFWSVGRLTGVIRLRIPKTIRFAVLKHPDFQPVKDKVMELLCNVVVPGTTPEELMEIRHVGRTNTRAAKAVQQERADRAHEAGRQVVP